MSMRYAVMALLAAPAVLAPVDARAEDADRISVEVRGEAAGADAAARGRAIDQAFATAVERAVAGLVGNAGLTKHRAAIDRDVVRRARRFVGSYRVVGEKVDGGKTRVDVAASVDLARLRSALGEIGVPMAGPGVAPAGLAPTPAAAGTGAILLLKITTPQGTTTTFGQGGGDGGPAASALGREIEAMGLALRGTAGQSVATTAGEADSLLPVGDDAAIDLARRSGASSAWVVGIDVRADGPIRSTRLVGAIARGKLRVLDAEKGGAIAEAEADGAGWGAEADPAAAGAARDLAGKLARAVEGRVQDRWATVAAGGPEVVVRVRGARTWGAVAALIRKLGGTAGVEAVHAREVARGRVALGVETRLPASKVAAAVQQARLPSGTASAQARGERQVEVEVRGETFFGTSETEEAAPGAAGD